MLKEMFLVAAIATTPTPAENYYSWISPQIADIVQQYVLDGKYYEFLDFNGDGELNVADVVGISKRYQDNCTYGNEMELDLDTIIDIAWENFSENMDRDDFIENDLLYWEICRVNEEPVRRYDLTVTEITEIELYYEFEDRAESISAVINPYEEYIQVK